ncbi:MAG: hypothetical protein QXQ14_03575 [Candidatus Aenigmatarchaeota archaeon]
MKLAHLLILMLFSITFSSNFLYLEISIDTSYNVSLITYYFQDFQEEKYEKSGNIEIRILDDKNNIVKILFSNVSESDFIKEVFSISKGKEIVKVPYVIKNFIFSLPENSSKIQIFVNKELKKEILIVNNSALIDSKHQRETEILETKKTSNDFLFYLLFFLAILGLIILIIKKLFS